MAGRFAVSRLPCQRQPHFCWRLSSILLGPRFEVGGAKVKHLPLDSLKIRKGPEQHYNNDTAFRCNPSLKQCVTVNRVMEIKDAAK